MKRILIALIGASTLGGVLLSVLPKRASNPEPMVELKASLQKAKLLRRQPSVDHGEFDPLKKP